MRYWLPGLGIIGLIVGFVWGVADWVQAQEQIDKDQNAVHVAQQERIARIEKYVDIKIKEEEIADERAVGAEEERKRLCIAGVLTGDICE